MKIPLPVLARIAPALLALGSPLRSGAETTRTVTTEERTVVVVSNDDVAVIFEEYTGRRPSDREVRRYHDLAMERRWDRDRFRDEFRRGDECRALTPDRVVESAFRDVLHRDPSGREFHLYMTHLETDGWTPGQVRRALRDSDEYREVEYERVIERAFRDVLERKPNRRDREHYLYLMTRRGMTEDELYRDLRDTPEYRIDIPNAKIVRAWKVVLGREPDLNGLERYRRTVVDRHYTQEDIERDLRKGPEFAERAEQLVRRAYLDLLGREADHDGLEYFKRKLIDGWNDGQVREALKKSPEYKNRRSGRG